MISSIRSESERDFWSWCSVARGRPGGSHTLQEWFAAYVVRAPGREAEGPRAAGPQAADPEPESDQRCWFNIKTLFCVK